MGMSQAKRSCGFVVVMVPLLLGVQVAAQGRLSDRVGVASLRAQGCHLAIDNGSLSAGAEVTLIGLDQPVRTVKVRVTSRIDRPHWPNQPVVALPNDRYAQVYGLDCSSIDPQTRFLGLGVIGFTGTVSQEGAGVVSDFDGTGGRYFAYSCTGSESVHFIIRANNQGVLLWRAAYYLGYDTEPTCKDADFR